MTCCRGPRLIGSFVRPASIRPLLGLGARGARGELALGTQDTVQPREKLAARSSAPDGEPGPSGGPDTDRKLAPSHTHIKTQLDEGRGVQGEATRGPSRSRKIFYPRPRVSQESVGVFPWRHPRLVCPGGSRFAGSLGKLGAATLVQEGTSQCL